MIVGITIALALYDGSRDTAEHWKALAARRPDLTYRNAGVPGLPSPRLAGRVGDVPVRAEIATSATHKVKPRGPATVVRAALSGLLPEGLSVEPEWSTAELLERIGLGDVHTGDDRIDRRLRITALDPPSAEALFRDAAVREAVDEPFRHDHVLIVRDGELQLAARGMLADAVETMLTQAAALAAAMSAALTRSWEALAAAHGLTIRIDERKIRLDGRWDGLPLMVHVGRTGGDATSHTTVRVQLPEGIPRSLWITLRDAGGEDDGVPLADPILAPLLRVRGVRPDAAAALLDDDDLRQRLLEVVHGHPGSAVRAGAVVLELPAFVAVGVAGPIEQATGLARALARRG